MIINKNEVLLLKLPTEGEDKFQFTLLKNGYTVKYLQILEFVFLNLPILTDKLKNVDKFSGMY